MKNKLIVTAFFALVSSATCCGMNNDTSLKTSIGKMDIKPFIKEYVPFDAFLYGYVLDAKNYSYSHEVLPAIRNGSVVAGAEYVSFHNIPQDGRIKALQGRLKHCNIKHATTCVEDIWESIVQERSSLVNINTFYISKNYRDKVFQKKFYLGLLETIKKQDSNSFVFWFEVNNKNKDLKEFYIELGTRCSSPHSTSVDLYWIDLANWSAEKYETPKKVLNRNLMTDAFMHWE